MPERHSGGNGGPVQRAGDDYAGGGGAGNRLGHSPRRRGPAILVLYHTAFLWTSGPRKPSHEDYLNLWQKHHWRDVEENL
jgi:hypothetical protein